MKKNFDNLNITKFSVNYEAMWIKSSIDLVFNFQFKILKYIFLILLTLSFTIGKCGESRILSEKEKIHLLLDELERSNLKFTRNGQEYPAREAKEHMIKKLDYAGSRIKTAEQFIEYIASKSSITGNPYYVIYPDGKKIESSKWLREVLNKIEASK